MGLKTIEDLKNALTQPSLASKYEIELSLPVLLVPLLKFDDVNTSIGDTLKILANKASLPSVGVSTTKIYHRGNPFTVRGAYTYPDDTWKVSFYNTSDMNLHTLFSKWVYEIDRFDNLLTNSLFLGNYVGFNSIGAGYMTDAKFNIKRPDGSTSATYEINYVYPVRVSEIPYSADSTNTVTVFDVDFAFSRFAKKEGFLQQLI